MSLNKEPLVSICLLCYNHEKYVARALESCINQSYKNIEIIIVDNASTDGSQKIIEKYTQENDNISFYPLNHNTFPSQGMNHAITHANGEYICLFSTDDYIELDKTKKQLDFMLMNKLSNAFTWVNIVNDHSEKITSHPMNDLFNRSFNNDELMEHFIVHGNTLNAGSVMVHKSIFKKYGLFDHRLLQLQDYEFWLRVIKNEPLHILEEKLANYCVRDDNQNLSLHKDRSVALRTNYESKILMEHILDFDPKVLSKVTNKICTQYNKYENLFTYYYKAHNQFNACGVVDNLYIHLENNFQFPSDIYDSFFKIYSEYDYFQIENIQEKDQQIQEKDLQIQEKDLQIQHLHEVLQSMRIKSRIKRVLKKIIPQKIWKILKYMRHNPNAIQDALHVLKDEGLTGLRHRLNKIYNLEASQGLSSYVYHEPSVTKSIKKEIASFSKKPLISIIMPVYNVDPKWLKLAVQSIEAQWYTNWELCIADDKSTNLETLEYLRSLHNKKIKVTFLETNGNISVASNAAIALVSGEYVALMDNDDELTPDALYKVVKAINNTDAEFIYSDEDKLELDGTYSDPHFKPDFAPDMFLSQNYLSHLGVIKKELIEKVNGFTVGLEGAQDYDLYLKVLEHTDKIYHIQKVLYHWRKIPGSTAAEFGEKSYAQDAGVMALQKAIERRNINAEVLNGKYPGTYRIKYAIQDEPLISIIIPFKDKPELLEMCIESILDKTTYKNWEVIGISNNSEEEDTFAEMKRLEKLDDRVKFYEYNVPFNYSDINNYAVNTYAKGEHIILLNNDIEIITPQWIESMLEFSQRKEIGAVGAKLYYPNDTIQHAGIAMGVLTLAGHNFKHHPRNSPAYMGRESVVQNTSAVTAACLMIKKSIFKEVNGLNEKDLKIAFNDVDFCLRVQENGYVNVFTPYCEAYHHESISRGSEDTEAKQNRFKGEVEFMQNRHQKILEDGDPYYNPNLTLNREDFNLK